MARKRIVKAQQKAFADYEREVYIEKNFLRKAFFRLYINDTTKGKMDFPTHEVTVGKDTCLVYDIPPERMQEALDRANHLKGDRYFPIRYKTEYKDAIIIYFNEHNFIVRPTFFEDGKTARGWGMSKEEFIVASSGANSQ